MSTDALARLKVTLDDVKPAVMRRLEVPLNLRLDRLHLALQATIGWTNSHLVESGTGAVAWAMSASLRFPFPLIKPDVRISRIRLSDWLHLKAHGMAPR
jgi:Plasmid pRiA4b ORF-3-like protein